MISIQINEIKNMMAHLLTRESFDWLYLEKASVLTCAKFSVEGKRNSGWYDENDHDSDDESVHSQLLSWSEARTWVFSLVRGEKTPDKMRISLKAPESVALKILQEGGCLKRYQSEQIIPEFYLMVRFEGGELFLVTGTSYPQFTMNKEADALWDDFLCRCLKKLDIGHTNCTKM